MKNNIMKMFFLSTLMILMITPLTKSIALTGLKVSGNSIVNSNGEKVHLRGVNKSGSEFACIQGNGFWDGTDLVGITQTILSWNVNIVRVPLNEQCWLNINVKAEYGGIIYQNAVDTYVNILLKNGMAVILDLHWTSSTGVANKQEPVPNTLNSVNFWKQVATKYGSNTQIIFDLFNEPFPDNNQDTTAAWTCLRDGGTCNGISYQVAGMQSLVDTIRAVGAKNILMVAGPEYSNSLTRWIEFKPKDALNNIVASWHSYNFNLCNNETCWNTYVAPVIASYPLIVGEIGGNDCTGNYILPLMKWLDARGANFLAWTFNAWDCSSGPALINSSGNPTAYGLAFKNYMANPNPSTITPSVAPVVSPVIPPTAGSCSTSLSVTFTSSNEYWIQTSFDKSLGSVSNVSLIYGTNTFALATTIFSIYDFTASSNGVRIPTGSTVTLKATVVGIEYKADFTWINTQTIALKCTPITPPASISPVIPPKISPIIPAASASTVVPSAIIPVIPSASITPITPPKISPITPAASTSTVVPSITPPSVSPVIPSASITPPKTSPIIPAASASTALPSTTPPAVSPVLPSASITPPKTSPVIPAGSASAVVPAIVPNSTICTSLNSTSFIGSNEWYVQITFGADSVNVSNVTLTFGTYKLTLINGWTPFIFLAKPNIAITTGSTVTLTAIIKGQLQTSNFKYLTEPIIFNCLNSAPIAKCAGPLIALFNGSSEWYLDVEFANNLGNVSNVILTSSKSFNLAVSSWSAFEFIFTPGIQIKTGSSVTLNGTVNGIKYSGTFPYLSGPVNLTC